VFASYQVTWLVALFGRLDLVQPIADTDGGVRDTYVNVGIETTPWKFLNLALVYKREEVDTGAAGFVFDTTNGKIGSMTPDASGTYQELGVFAQLVF
jgi:hypothetical protein